MNVIRGESGALNIEQMVAEQRPVSRSESLRAGGLTKSVAVNAVAGGLSLLVALVVFPQYSTKLGLTNFGIVLIGLSLATIVINLDLGMGAVIGRRSAYIGSALFRSDYAVGRAAVRLRWASMLPGFILLLFALLGDTLVIGGYLAVLSLAVFGGLLPVFFRTAQSRYEGAGNFLVPRAFIVASCGIRLLVAFTISTLPQMFQVAVVLMAETSVFWLPAVGCAMLMRSRSTEITPSPTRESWSSLTIYGAGSCVSAIVGAVVLNVDTLVVGAVLAPSTVVVFAAGARMIQVFRQVVGWIAQPLLSRMMSIHSFSGNSGLANVWMVAHPLAVSALSAVASAVVFGGLLLLPVLLPEASVDEIWDARVVLILLGAGAIVSSAHQVGLLVLTALKKPLSLLPSQIAWALMRAAFGACLGYFYGVAAAAIGIYVATLLIEPNYLLVTARNLDLCKSTVFKRAGAPAIGCSLITATVGYCAVELTAFGPWVLLAWVGVLTLFTGVLVKKLSSSR